MRPKRPRGRMSCRRRNRTRRLARPRRSPKEPRRPHGVSSRPRDAQDMIDQARRVDANVTEAEKALAEAGGAMVAKDYKVAVDKANEALERGKRNYRDRARAIVDSSANLGRLAKGVGADLAETESTLAKAEGALAGGDLGVAIDL